MIITGMISQKERDFLRARKKEGKNCFHDIKIKKLQINRLLPAMQTGLKLPRRLYRI
jgi:hypothetical protein